MEIHSLRFVATEQDLNDLLCRFFRLPGQIANLRISLIPERVRITGTYQAAIGIPFETLWSVSTYEGKIAARLETLKAGFLSLGLAKNYLLGAVAAVGASLEVQGDSLLFDLDACLLDNELPIHTHLASVRCELGSLIIECGPSRGTVPMNDR